MEDENYTPRLKKMVVREKKNTIFTCVSGIDYNYSKTRKVYKQKTAPTYINDLW